jgi:putative Ca2+/H+ antiporter (TMEM165/GDT1 family)
MTESGEKPSGRPGFFAVLLSTFTTVFLAELGDKTQLATLLLSAQSGSPGLVFLGAAFALICSSLVGVLVGQWLAKTLPPERIEFMAGVLMVCLGLWLGFQASRSLFVIGSQA